MTSDLPLSQSLDVVERHESRFLAWGILDRSMTRSEIESLLAEGGDADPRKSFEELVRRLLIFEIPRSSPPRYRSRMAESVRLFASLRQQFPGRPWATAPRLVADFRFLVRPRRFPVRFLDHDDVLARLGGVTLTTAAKSALRALLAGGDGGSARRLSRFQVEATRDVLSGLSSEYDKSFIVTAGTGSGKTLAFYLPTLMHLVSDPSRGKGTRVLAVYPRNELLKDQLLATLRETRRLRAADPSLPGIRIGAYFGPTPTQGGSRPIEEFRGWRNRSGGAVCPFLTCPGIPGGTECGGALLWTEADRRADRGRLVCERCDATVEPDELALTRNGMQKSPPDIVFATTEMLNRSLSDAWSCHVFGVGPQAKVQPRIILLDEAHTYSGPSGAQAAYVLRRWRHLAGGPVVWVGLSATLRDAEQFFARLTGTSADFVREIAPQNEDLEQRGHEYQLILRGDPASQTALLSTSIQSLMLLLRVLDPLGEEPALGFFGHKVFAFCDNLDLTNRLFRQLLDAEGRNPVGKPDPRKDGSLALLRSEAHRRDVDDWRERDRAGQDWWMVDQLRPNPAPPVIGRTSSQDTGVTGDAETVVATASLEVGYDDPAVGAVLQHKAPRDLAQFLQRRGRAGRSQEMRPWTVVVLSDYGRDRLTYQSYERLFDPALPPKALPLGNRSVQRMQATFAVLDWVATRLRRNSNYKDTVRQYFAQPQKVRNTERQQLVAEILLQVLEGEDELAELTLFLERSLRLSADEVAVLLWEGPRAVLLEAIPTALRRIRSGWHAVIDGKGADGADRQRRDHPLPDFVPANLFTDLSLPEVQIVPPDGYDRSADTEEPVFLALNELAPGSVTLRWAVWKTKGLWIDPGPGGPLDIAETLLQDADLIARVPGGHDGDVDVMRPFSVHPVVPPVGVQPTSNGRLHWQVRVSPVHEALEGEMPDGAAWSSIVDRVDFFLQAGRGGVRLLRYAAGGSAELSIERSGRRRVDYQFKRGDADVAIGVELDVDALRVRVRPPASVEEFDLDADPRRLRQLRRDYFVWHVESDVGTRDGLNPFLASWLAELTVGAVAAAVTDEDAPPSPADWSESEWRDRLLRAFDRAFQAFDDDGAIADDLPLRSAIEDAIAQAHVRTGLISHWQVAMADPDERWYPWLRERFAVTAAAAIHSAVQAILTDFDADTDLVVDLQDHPEGVDVWLSDVAVGGGGMVEALFVAYTEDPRRFWHIAIGALDPQDLEQSAEVLRRIVAELDGDPLRRIAADFRSATSDVDALLEWRRLLREVSRRGYAPTHSLAVAMSTRIVRPGSTEETDRAILKALDHWDLIEDRLGIALDHRTACALVATQPNVLDELRRSAPEAGLRDAGWAFSVLLGVLWPSAEAIRAHSLRTPMTFTDRPPVSERTLVLDRLVGPDVVVGVEDDGWRERADAQARQTGRFVLGAAAGREDSLKAALIELMVVPIELGSLHLHPRVVGIRRRLDAIEVELELMEAPQ